MEKKTLFMIVPVAMLLFGIGLAVGLSQLNRSQEVAGVPDSLDLPPQGSTQSPAPLPPQAPTREISTPPQTPLPTPVPVDQVLAQAVSAYYAGQKDLARRQLASGMESHPRSSIQLELALQLEELGEWSVALRHFQSFESEPVHWARALFRAGELEQAKPLLETAFGRGDQLAGLDLAQLHLDRQEAQQALAVLERIQVTAGMATRRWALMGEAYARLGQWSQAASALSSAISTDSSWVQLHLPLAQALEASGRFAEALQSYQRAQASDPLGRSAAGAAIARLEKSHPHLFTTQRQEREERRRDLRPITVPAPARRDDQILRIGLITQGRVINFMAGSQAQLLGPDGEVIAQIQPEQAWQVLAEPEGLRIQGPDLILRSPGPIRIRQENPQRTFLVYDVQFGQGQFWSGVEDRQYRGELEFFLGSDGLTLVNLVGLEEYLYSVVPSEMPSTWPMEALKAQAVAARTFAINRIGYHRSQGFDLCATTDCKVYNGASWEREAPRQAVEETRGLILVHGGRPIDAVFSSNAGGHTEFSQFIWSHPVPYLQGVPEDPSNPFPLPLMDLATWLRTTPDLPSRTSLTSATNFRWTRVFTREEVERLVPDVGEIQRIEILSRSPSGRVERLAIQGSVSRREIRGQTIRNLFSNLKSTLFVLETQRDAQGRPIRFVFTGGGWGHGVGLDQAGAAGRAQRGHDFRSILLHYYQGAEIRPIN